MRDSDAVLSVRSAMLFTVLKRLGLVRDPVSEKALSQRTDLLKNGDAQATLKGAECYGFGTVSER